MRFVLFIVGLLLMIAAGLWFFTPYLDSTYARYAPPAASRTAPSAPTTTNRSAAPSAAPSAGSASRAAAPRQESKFGFDNMLSVINFAAGLIGAWFTFMSYRLQRRQARDDR
jgi:hypothetical protein